MALGAERRKVEGLFALAALKENVIRVDIFQISFGGDKTGNDWRGAIGTSEQEHMSEAHGETPRRIRIREWQRASSAGTLAGLAQLDFVLEARENPGTVGRQLGAQIRMRER
jgi:hypothetical protein